MPPSKIRIEYQSVPDVYDILGQSPQIMRVRNQVDVYAPSERPVVISGETGTGKELVARALHIQSGRQGSFLEINCSSLAEALQESLLFGYAPGTFTGQNHSGKQGLFEAAVNGTLFLDEFGYTSPELKNKLLKAIEQREIVRMGDNFPTPVNTRVVIASPRSLDEMLQKKEIQPDMYYRLKGATIQLPPLRERIYDVGIIAEWYTNSYSGGAVQLGQGALSLLMGHTWPGNVRELKTVLETVIDCKIADMRGDPSSSTVIDGKYINKHSPFKIHLLENTDNSRASASLSFVSYSEMLFESIQYAHVDVNTAFEQLKGETIKRALAAAKGNQAMAARLLGTTERAIWYEVSKLKKAKDPQIDSLLDRDSYGVRPQLQERTG